MRKMKEKIKINYVCKEKSVNPWMGQFDRIKWVTYTGFFSKVWRNLMRVYLGEYERIERILNL